MELENFRNYKRMTFNFDPNRFCVITGPNGSGKTTLAIDGICWCLFDETSKGRKGDAVIRKRSGKNTRVTLRFFIDDDMFYIENNRHHDEYGDMKTITKNGESITGATRAETNKRIVDLIMPKDVFKNCLLFSQYVNKPFAEMGDTGQKNIFDLMMGFDKYNQYYENSKEYIKTIVVETVKLNEELLLLGKSYEQHKELLESELKNKENLVNSFETRKQELTFEITNLETETARLKNEISDNDNLSTKYKSKQDSISKTSSELAILRSQSESRKELIESKISSDRNNDLAEVDKKFMDIINNIKVETDSINSEYAVLKQELNAKNESLKSEYFKRENEITEPIRKELELVTNDFKDAINKSNMLSNSINDQHNDRESIIRSIEDMETQLNKDNPTCFACKQEIRGSNLKEIETIVKNEKVKLSERESEIERLNTEKKISDRIASENELIINNLKAKNIEESSKLLEWKTKAIQELTEYRDSRLACLKQREDKINAEREGVDRKKSISVNNIKSKYQDLLISELNNLKKEFETSIFKLESKLKDMNRDKEIIEELIEHERAVNNRINLNSGIINAKKEELNNTLVNSHNDRLSECEVRIKRFKTVVDEDESKNTEIKKKIDELDREIDIAKFWKKAFSPKGIRAILLDESIPILNDMARELSSKTDCIRVRFSSQKPLKSGELRNQFCVLPIQTTNLTDEREDFSVGEGRMVDIITLLSLRHLLEVTYDRTFNISLFDEILDSLYRNNAEIVLDFLRKMSEESCTILITHTLRNYIEPDEHLELGR